MACFREVNREDRYATRVIPPINGTIDESIGMEGSMSTMGRLTTERTMPKYGLDNIMTDRITSIIS